jgi:hypothetical protein
VAAVVVAAPAPQVARAAQAAQERQQISMAAQVVATPFLAAAVAGEQADRMALEVRVPARQVAQAVEDKAVVVTAAGAMALMSEIPTGLAGATAGQRKI